MAVKIRLKRMGQIREAHYRVVVVDSRKKRDGRVIEEIGYYNPNTDPSIIQIDSERAQYWISVGAQPTDTVLAQLKITGDWQAAKGLEGESTLKTYGTADAAEKRKAAVEAVQSEAEKRRADKAAAIEADAKAAEAAKAEAEKEAAAEAEEVAEEAPAAEAEETEEA